MSNANQLYLLADHVKLSLLERERAISLGLEPDSQDGHISRSLDSFREGLESLTRQRDDLQASGDASAASTLQDAITTLQSQLDDLNSQFHGFPTPNTTSSISQPNDPTLSEDFARASERPRVVSQSSFLKKSRPGSNGPNSPGPKSVRFSDHPQVSAISEEDVTRRELFPYRDDPVDSGPPDQTHLDNQQIHAYHSQVIAEQDEQLDRLGASISRQRELSIQIGDELDGHVALLDEVDGHVDRHQSRLDQARKGLGKVARKANDNKQLTTIFVLIIILVLLIAVFK